MKNTFFISLFCLLAQCAFGTKLTYFSVQARPATGNTQNVRLCYLDAAHQIKDQINHHLQSHPGNTRLSVQTRTRFKALSQGYLCQIRAKQLGVNKIPAVVFNGHYVIYGITNLTQARHLFDMKRVGQ